MILHEDSASGSLTNELPLDQLDRTGVAARREGIP
jgi:hypothetical protein